MNIEVTIGNPTNTKGHLCIAQTELYAANGLETQHIVEGVKYTVEVQLSDGTSFGAATDTAAVNADFTATARGTLGTTGSVHKQINQLRYAASEGLLQSTVDTNMLTSQIEDVQAKINTARVQAGSQYAAIESAINYTTDLTAQYELGFNTVNDVNFSMETAHLAKNQILQQAATAMLAQANASKQNVLSLLQG
jgi:flagellin